MSGVVLNIIAWIGSAAFAFLIIKEFISAERYYKKHEDKSQEE